MKNIKYNLVMVFSLLSIPIFSEVAGIFNAKWSGYQGKMNWIDATAKCKSIGMRLPTKDELLIVFKAGLTESWKKDGNWYWTSTNLNWDSSRAYGVTIDGGVTASLGNINEFSYHVRCIQ